MRYAIPLAVALVLCVSATGCDNNPVGPPGTLNGTLRATFDGSAWTAPYVITAYSGGMLAVAATDGAGRAISLGLVPDVGAGTYAVADSMQTYATIVLSGNASWTAAGSSGTGSITITSMTANSATGTFTFIGAANAGSGATGTKTVTNGSFDVTF